MRQAPKVKVIVTSADLVAYAQSLGWMTVEYPVKDGLYVLWHKSFPERQLVFPIDATSPDYYEAMLRAVEKITEPHTTDALNVNGK